MQAPLSPVPPGVIADLCLRDLSRIERFRSAKRDWQMKPLSILPERPTIRLEHGNDYKVIAQ
ncbi:MULTISPECIES: hypothetical protein [unclassified Paracoccus (in: a-proteobacteria)]|uniref:hypothetical protein n=1 Tax=unclassified Paracoccus (in: a-proteobacteria) TaxID=2688777 RepID=UPI0012B2CA46|nr:MULTISPECIES: hypothetical protein [unclassified Paracoccus (in: a-proteobacteria)]UXU73793.1 hypothetical protein GB879_007540 [Paracoccus sp. SMMA_5]UXU79683.1 hypothetical protein GB880_007530 [Paracoccus sp. SMMA_5_TC]